MNPASFGVLDCFGEMTGWWQRHGFLEEKRWGYCDWWWQRSQNEAILRCSRSIPEKKLTPSFLYPSFTYDGGHPVGRDDMKFVPNFNWNDTTSVLKFMLATTHWSEWFWAWNCKLWSLLAKSRFVQSLILLDWLVILPNILTLSDWCLRQSAIPNAETWGESCLAF